MNHSSRSTTVGRKPFVLLCAAALMGAAVGCGAGKPAGPDPSVKLEVCVGLQPLYEWAQAVAGPDATVHRLQGSGGDPHGFAPSMQDVAQLGRSRALLVIGLGLDPWARRALDSAKGTGTELLEAGTWVERRKLAGEHDHDHGHAHDHSHDGHATNEDPHVWLDPHRAARIVERLGEEFARLDPGHADAYRSRAKAEAARLHALAEELMANAKSLRGKKAVTLHDAYGYLFDLCGLELAGVVQVSPGIEPGARDVSNAVAQMKNIGQRVVFAEPSKEAAARVIAEALGGQTVLLDPLELPESPCGKDYAERMRHNVKMLLEHLK